MICYVVAPPRSILQKAEACAITQRTIGLIAALRRGGNHVIVYANKGSESEAYEHVDILTKPPFVEDWFYKRLDELPGDGGLVFHTWPRKPGASFLSRHTIHVEAGVGYDFPPWGAHRIYESEAWRHHLWGKYGSTLADRQNSWVIPWPFDVADWPVTLPLRTYVSFLGRLVPDKGFAVLKEIARVMPSVYFRVAGTGYAGKNWPANVDLAGSIYGRDRAEFLSHSLVHLCPTEYVEPLNGSAIEAMLCGAPVVASDWGGFTETVEPGVTGFRASTIPEWIDGIHAAIELDRAACRQRAIERFSIEAAVPKYARVIDRLVALRG